MINKKEYLFENISTFIILGVTIAFFIFLLYLFFYVAIWGVFLGIILWLGSLVKNYLFPTQTIKPEQGRIIEHDEEK